MMMTSVRMPGKVIKRDGAVVSFDKSKIEQVIGKAAYEVTRDKTETLRIQKRVTESVVGTLRHVYKDKLPAVEAIQDIVEHSLMEEGYGRVAKSYILYRERHSDSRLTKGALGLKDDLKLPLNTMEVLRRRYLLKDDRGRVIETPSELFRRVAHHVSRAEKNFKSNVKAGDIEEKFYQMMRGREFMPNSPALMNAGISLGQLSACFVIPVADSLESIFEAVKNMAAIHQTGGGVGFNFSRIRPKGDLVSSTGGEASGPVSFMRIFNEATGVIIQGGRRRGANMGIVRCDHPDILDFIEAKREEGEFANFNLSVGVTDKFMRAVNKNSNFNLINPRTKKSAQTIKARAVFDLIVDAAWRTGDPGLIFLDEINRRNPTPLMGEIETTNPCGELPLLPYESCTLASVNLARMIKGSSFDWDKLKDSVIWGIRFLDDVIEVNKFPLPEIKRMAFANRKIGLGIMGFADMLIRLGIPYHSEKAVLLAGKIMKFMRQESLKASGALAGERGVFPNFKRSIYVKKAMKLRNATLNTIAPTGTISIIAGCSSGIEPLFAIGFVRNVLSGAELFEVNPLFESAAKERGIYNKELLARVAQSGSLKGLKGVPKDLKKIFITAFDVTAQQHLRIQAAFQRFTDNAVSKTINLPNSSTVEDVRKIYLSAYKLKCKGITIYRYGSKKDQVLSFSGSRMEAPGGRVRHSDDLIRAESEYSGGCATAGCPF